MKKLVIILTVLLYGISGHAQYRDSHNILEKLLWDDEMLNILIDTRVDFQAKMQNSELDNASFVGQTFKILFVGEVVPGFRYRIRHRFNTPQSYTRDNYSPATDHAWLEFDAGKHWTFTAGRISAQLGTFEYDYNPADIYAATIPGSDFDGYKGGVNAAYKVAGQIFNFEIMNSDSPQFATEEYKDKALGFAFMWQGDLFDELIRTRWGYAAFQHDKKKFYQWLTFGNQVNIKKFTAELDYYHGFRNMDYSDMVGINDTGYFGTDISGSPDSDGPGSRYIRDQAVSAKLEYDFGKWRPFIKGTWSQRYDKQAENIAYHIKGIQAVAELYPFTSNALKDLRFHAAYVYSNTNYQSYYNYMGNKDDNYIFLGARWIFKAK